MREKDTRGSGALAPSREGVGASPFVCVRGEGMVRGTEKRVIYLKHTGSELIEEAFFLVKDQEEGDLIRESDIVKEASRILREGDAGLGKGRRGNEDAVLFFLMGFSLAALLSLLLSFFV